MNTELIAQPDYGFDEGLAPPGEAEAPVNPLMLVHRYLRGRYPLAVALGALLAVPCAVIGYKVMPPKYTSTGVVNIAPTRPYILYENEFTEGMSSFSSFVQSQANLLKSQRVLQAALDNSDLREAGWPPYPAGLGMLQDSVEVDVPRSSQDVFVKVTTTDPGLARAAVNAILDEYATIAISGEATQMQKTIDTISELRDEADQERQDLRSRAYQLAEREGTDDLARRRESMHEQLGKIDQMLLDLNVRLLPFEGDASADGQAGNDDQAGARQASDQPDADAPPDPEALAAFDAELADLLARRRQAELQRTSLSARYSPAHRSIIELDDQIKTLDTLIQARASIVAASAPTGTPGVATGSSEKQLRLQRQRLQELRDKTSEEAKRIGSLQLEIDRLREEAARADEKFRDADARLQSLLIQKRDGQQGRISITQKADIPLGPSTDRRKPLAAMGALGGGGAGVAAVMLFGILRPRYRYISEIEEQKQSVRIIGAIPDIQAEDQNSHELVNASVHQIRTVIDARLLGAGQGGVVHVVTSAAAGEGKSTVTLRLAKSFAISGKRSVIVDADLVGRKASSKFAMQGMPGFAEAVIEGADPLALVRPTGQENLSFLPAGAKGPLLPERVSASAAIRVLQALCAEYDAVLVDTGPILGSIEAQSIVPIADEVLLVVSRGTGVRLVRLAIDRLNRLGAKRLGVVFNRATMQDLERSTSFSVTSQRFSEAHADFDADHGPRATANSA